MISELWRCIWHVMLCVGSDSGPKHSRLNIMLQADANYCVRGTRTQPLICVWFSVQYWMSCAIYKGGFFEIAFVVVVVDTHLPRFEALAYVLPHFDALTHVVIRVSSAFIFQTFAEVCYSVFVNGSSFLKSVLNLRKANIFKSLLKLYYIDLCLLNLSKRSSFKSFGGCYATK